MVTDLLLFYFMSDPALDMARKDEIPINSVNN
jgi:hypothetical protein